MDQITKLYNEIVAHDPSLAAHKDKIFSLIEQMVEAKPTVSFDPHWKDAFDSKLAEHIANWQPATTAPFSYGWMTKRAMAVSSFFIIGAVTAAGIWYIQVEHKQQQKIAMTKSTQVEQSSESEANTSLALRDGDTSVQNPEALSDIASDSIMNVNADLPPGQLKKSTKVAVTPPGLIDK